jgi:hypothetical protein
MRGNLVSGGVDGLVAVVERGLVDGLQPDHRRFTRIALQEGAHAVGDNGGFGVENGGLRPAQAGSVRPRGLKVLAATVPASCAARASDMMLR